MPACSGPDLPLTDDRREIVKLGSPSCQRIGWASTCHLSTRHVGSLEKTIPPRQLTTASTTAILWSLGQSKLMFTPLLSGVIHTTRCDNARQQILWQKLARSVAAQFYSGLSTPGAFNSQSNSVSKSWGPV